MKYSFCLILPDSEGSGHQDCETWLEVRTEVLLEVGGEGGQQLQAGLQTEGGAGPQVVGEGLHYLCLTEHNLAPDFIISDQSQSNCQTVPESAS